MKTLLLAGAAVQRVLEARDWRFRFIGGVANYRWGTPRLTNDLDLTLLTGFGAEEAYVGELLSAFEERTIARSSPFEFLPGASLRTCAAEDLIVHKAFAARAQDRVDVEGVILKQQGVLGWRQTRSELGELTALKGAPELPGELERIADRVVQVIGPFDRDS